MEELYYSASLELDVAIWLLLIIEIWAKVICVISDRSYKNQCALYWLLFFALP